MQVAPEDASPRRTHQSKSFPNLAGDHVRPIISPQPAPPALPPQREDSHPKEANANAARHKSFSLHRRARSAASRQREGVLILALKTLRNSYHIGLRRGLPLRTAAGTNESYKFDGEESALHFERRTRLTKLYNIQLAAVTTLLVVIIGIVTGIVAASMVLLEERAHKAIAELTALVMGVAPPAGRLWSGFAVYVGLSLALVLSASLLALSSPTVPGSGLPALKAYLNGVQPDHEWASWRLLVAKTLGITAVVSTGIPLGKEGPMVHIGSMLGAQISRLRVLGLERFLELRLPRAQREWVGMGAAAGVAAAFNAPLGGILYSFEEVCSSWSAELTWRSFVCNVVVSMTLAFCIHYTSLEGEGFVNSLTVGGLGGAPHPPVTSNHLVWISLLALVGGLVGALYNIGVARMVQLRERLHGDRPLRQVAEAGVLCLVTFAFYFFVPHALGCETCPPTQPHADDTHLDPAPACGDAHSDHLGLPPLLQHTCEAGHYSPLATLLLGGQEKAIRLLLSGNPATAAALPALTTLLPMALYAALAIVLMGSRLPGGNFVPGIVIGATIGRLTGAVLLALGGLDQDSLDDGFLGVLALTGAAAVLCGMTRMTLTVAAILAEVTHDINLLPTTMLTVALAKFVADLIAPSFDECMIRLARLPVLEETPQSALGLLVARDVMADRDLTYLSQRVTAAHVHRLLRRSRHNGFPVLGSSKDGSTSGRVVIGLVERRQLLVVLQERMWEHDDGQSLTKRTQDRFVGSQDLLRSGKLKLGYLRDEDKQRVIDLGAFIDPSPLVVGELMPLSRVYRLFNEIGVRHLPVVDRNQQLVGMITRKDLLASVVEEKLEGLDLFTPWPRAWNPNAERKSEPSSSVRSSVLAVLH